MVSYRTSQPEEVQQPGDKRGGSILDPQVYIYCNINIIYCNLNNIYCNIYCNIYNNYCNIYNINNV